MISVSFALLAVGERRAPAGDVTHPLSLPGRGYLFARATVAVRRRPDGAAPQTVPPP